MFSKKDFFFLLLSHLLLETSEHMYDVAAIEQIGLE